LNGDKDEQALTLLDIVVPLQHPLSVLQEARRHALTRQAVLRRRHAYGPSAALLVASDEILPLESAERYPAPSQKLPTSKQSTSPAAPTLAPPLLSASIAPNPLFLNLLPINSPSQTGDSNLVADKTIDSSHKERVPQQRARRHALASPPLVASDEMTPLESADRRPAPSQKLQTSKQSTSPAAPAYKTIDNSHKETVPQQQGHSLLPLPVNGSGQPLLPQESAPSPTVQVPIGEDGAEAVLEGQNMPLQDIVAPLQHSLLPLPINGSGQPLLSQESTSLFTVQVPIDEVGEEAVLEGQIMQRQDMGSLRSRSYISRAGRYLSRLVALSIQWCWSISSLDIEWPPPVDDNGILHTPPSPRLPPSPPSSPSFPFRRSDAPPFFLPGRSDDSILPTPPSSTSPRSDDGILPTPPFYTRLPSTYSLRRSGSSPTCSGLPQKACSTPVPRSSPSTLGAHSLPFSPLPSPHLSPSSSHQLPVLTSLPFPPPLLPSLPALLASLHSLLLHNRQVAQFSVPCPFLVDIACHYVSLCRSLISPPSPSLLFPSATGEST